MNCEGRASPAAHFNRMSYVMHIAMTRYGELWCAESEECVVCPNRNKDFNTALNKVIEDATDQRATPDEGDTDVVYIIFHANYEGYSLPGSWVWNEIVDLHELESAI